MSIRFLRIVLASVVSAFLSGAASSAEITDMVVRQQWPWGRLVTIDYRLSASIGETADVSVKVLAGGVAVDTIPARAFSGDLDSVAAGEHRIVFDPAAAGLDSGRAITNLAFSVSAKSPIGGKYMVIDVSAGTDAESYGVSYLDEMPVGGWQNVHKTSKIVLRRIRAGTFLMGSPLDEGGRRDNEALHTVILTNDYYIGVFPVTRGQWRKVKSDVTPGDHYTESGPAIGVSWDDIAGSGTRGEDTNVDAASFLGLLGARVNASLPQGYVVAFPSEAQWEYACRAGTTTAWNNGTDYSVYTDTNNKSRDDNLTLLGLYLAVNANNCSKTVGTYLPNAWGLYDCHGNAGELVADTIYTDGSTRGPEITQTEPRNVKYPNYRIYRGGNWQANPSPCRSAAKTHLLRSTRDSKVGFRLAVVREVRQAN